MRIRWHIHSYDTIDRHTDQTEDHNEQNHVVSEIHFEVRGTHETLTDADGEYLTVSHRGVVHLDLRDLSGNFVDHADITEEHLIDFVKAWLANPPLEELRHQIPTEQVIYDKMEDAMNSIVASNRTTRTI